MARDGRVRPDHDEKRPKSAICDHPGPIVRFRGFGRMHRHVDLPNGYGGMTPDMAVRLEKRDG